MKDLQYTIKGSDSKEMLVDLLFKGSSENRKVVIFSHGFKGFKDWGCFPLVSRCFAEQNFVFVKFNFSHNGTTSENPSDFEDLESFGNNNFSKEVYDLDKVISWICSKFRSPEITLLGHSRGRGISMIKAASDERTALAALENLLKVNERKRQLTIRKIMNRRERYGVSTDVPIPEPIEMPKLNWKIVKP